MREVSLVQTFIGRTKGALKRQAPTILTVVGTVGVIATTVATAKGAIKASRLLEKAEQQKGKELTIVETIKIAAPSYIPAIVGGAVTITCILGANVLSKRQQASLISAYGVLDQSFKKYKRKVDELYGDDSDKEIRESIAKDKYEQQPIEPEKLLFFDDYSGRYFNISLEEIKDAAYQFNRSLVINGGVSLNELYELLGLEITEYGDSVGWAQAQIWEYYWCDAWVDFKYELIENTDPEQPDYYMLDIPFGPEADYLDY